MTRSIVPGAGPPEPLSTVLGEVDHQALGRQRPADAGADRLFVVDEQHMRPGIRDVSLFRAARQLRRGHRAPAGATGAVPMRSRPFRRSSGGNSHPGTATGDAMSIRPLCKGSCQAAPPRTKPTFTFTDQPPIGSTTGGYKFIIFPLSSTDAQNARIDMRITLPAARTGFLRPDQIGHTAHITPTLAESGI